MKYDYDVIIIGAGSGGLNIAMFMTRLNMKVLLIDKSDKSIGGDCLNFGCVPSKALIHCAREVHSAKKSTKFGFEISGNTDLKKVAEYIDSKKKVIREHENAEYFREQGIDVKLGSAKFAGKNSVEVNGEVYSGKKIILATGSRARMFKIEGDEKMKILNNENIFDLEELPENLVIIGGGPIGVEIGQAYQRLGSQVRLIEKGPKFLPKENPEVASILREELVKYGIRFEFNSNVTSFPNSKEAIVKNDETGEEKTVPCDAVLMSAGRVLNLEGLELEKAGIKLDETGHKLKVDKYLRTTNKKVLTCGDIAGGYQFTHAAELHAGVILNNFFSPFKKKLSYDNLSWVTFTDPQIATFGISEEEIKKRNLKYEKLEFDFDEDDRAIVDEGQNGKLIVYIDRKEKLLGGTMIGQNAGEVFQELVLAKNSGLKAKDIFNKIYAYPTASRVNKRIFSLHYAKKLTPITKKILKWLY